MAEAEDANWLTCSLLTETLMGGKAGLVKRTSSGLIREMQSEPGAALTEPENKISQHHVGSRAGAEKFHSHSNVTKCNLSLCMTSSFT